MATLDNLETWAEQNFLFSVWGAAEMKQNKEDTLPNSLHS